MKIYFLYQNDTQEGPFSLDELRERHITASTPVWTAGMKDWMPAGQVPELVHFFATATPPPYHSNRPSSVATPPVYDYMTPVEKTGYSIGRMLGWGGLVILFICVTLVIINYNNSDGATNYTAPASVFKTEKEIKADKLTTEQNNPLAYIQTEFLYRPNLLGETVINGTFLNTATLTSYKDVQLTITWYSKTNTAVETQRRTLFEYLSPGQTVTCKWKLSGPSRYSHLKVNVVGATPN